MTASSRALLAAVALLLAPAALPAQQTPARPDTLPRRPAPADTARVEERDTAVLIVPPRAFPPDTVPGAERDPVRVDSLIPAPLIPAYPQPDSAGFWQGTWVWDQEALDRFHGVTLLDLLATVPGVVITRTGGFGMPAGVAPFGLGGGRTRVFLDGWEVDPLSSATLDLQGISLTELGEVRVERRPDEIRIELFHLRVPDRRPFTMIEMGVGEPSIRFLRGVYSGTLGERQVLTAGFDIADTEGLRRRQPFSVSNIFARWSYRFGARAAVQAEYRTTDLDRADEAFPESADRGSFWVRGRFLPLGNLTVDATVGRNWRNRGDGDDAFRDDMEATQAALRAILTAGRTGWLEGVARVRRDDEEAFAVPTSDLAVRAGLRPAPFLEVQGGARAATIGGESGTELDATARLGPRAGLSVFGTVTRGTRGIGLVTGDSLRSDFPLVVSAQVDTVPVFGTIAPTVSGVRAGAEWSRPGATVGAALLRLDPDRVAPFGLRLDDRLFEALGGGEAFAGIETGEATGYEAYVSTPLFRPWLRLEGYYTGWTDTGGHPYLPERQGRAALEYHDLFYTGNLEPTVRVEVVHRGAAFIPGLFVEDGEGAPAPVMSEPYTLVNAFLQIRVIDVRAFAIVENVFNLRTAADVPGFLFPPARAIYGVRWHFRN